MSDDITAEILLHAYASGVFPMAESEDDPEIFWVDPHLRGILPLDGFHISRSLRKALLRGDYEIRIDTAFEEVVRGCADRDETWINAQIFALYSELFQQGYAHSLEVWSDGDLIGGVYGVAIGAAFFGESMFSRRKDASKIALAYLTDRLRIGGFQLFDTQFMTPHLASLGGCETGRLEYRRRLSKALSTKAEFGRQGEASSPQKVIQRNTQTS